MGIGFRRALLAFGLVGLLTGCTYARIYATSGNAIALTTVQPGASDTFTVTKQLVFDYTGSVDVEELLKPRYGTGVTAQNVTMKLKSTVGDFFINLFTLGLANSRTVEISGDIVRKQ